MKVQRAALFVLIGFCDALTKTGKSFEKLKVATLKLKVVCKPE